MKLDHSETTTIIPLSMGDWRPFGGDVSLALRFRFLSKHCFIVTSWFHFTWKGTYISPGKFQLKFLSCCVWFCWNPYNTDLKLKAFCCCFQSNHLYYPISSLQVPHVFCPTGPPSGGDCVVVLVIDALILSEWNQPTVQPTNRTNRWWIEPCQGTRRVLCNQHFTCQEGHRVSWVLEGWQQKWPVF